MKLYYEKYLIFEDTYIIAGDDNGVCFVGTPNKGPSEIHEFIKPSYESRTHTHQSFEPTHNIESDDNIKTSEYNSSDNIHSIDNNDGSQNLGTNPDSPVYEANITLTPSEGRFVKVRDFIENLFYGDVPSVDFDFTIITGTELQQKVWKTLLEIPAGQTISYADLAIQSGYPHAIRAVATAVANNPLLFVIPCHRVIKSDGSLGNYRGGKFLKQKLLGYERQSLLNKTFDIMI